MLTSINHTHTLIYKRSRDIAYSTLDLFDKYEDALSRFESIGRSLSPIVLSHPIALQLFGTHTQNIVFKILTQSTIGWEIKCGELHLAPKVSLFEIDPLELFFAKRFDRTLFVYYEYKLLC